MMLHGRKSRKQAAKKLGEYKQAEIVFDSASQHKQAPILTLLTLDQLEELRIKEELGRQFRDLELAKKFCQERLREAELKQKQLEGLKLKDQFVLKEKDLEKRCRYFEFEKERQRKDLDFSGKQCEQQLKEVKLMEKIVKDELEEIGLKEKEDEFGEKERDLGQHCRDVEFQMIAFRKFEECKEKEEQFRSKMSHSEQCSRDFAMEETSVDLEAKEKHYA
ncbi:hypothetical protein V6N12_024156 [Hibiscus sabdariffa]|uniref:Uncharacterized protein n=1 Tax=Hibiscus sabdariffa TaxID=183260 RepID=A0ABR2FZS4_9ROSI